MQNIFKYILVCGIFLHCEVIWSFFSKPLRREIILALWHIWESTPPMSTHTHTLDLEWTIKADCDSGNALKSETEWLAISSEWKAAERVVLTEALASARINVGHTHLLAGETAHTRTCIYCIYTCLSPTALLCLDSLNLVIALLRQIMPRPVQVFPFLWTW